jgi:hypothetical protein
MHGFLSLGFIVLVYQPNIECEASEEPKAACAENDDVVLVSSGKEDMAGCSETIMSQSTTKVNNT